MEVFSTLLGSGIQGQIVGSYHAHMMNGCSVSNKTLHNTSTHSLMDSLENTVRAGLSPRLLLWYPPCHWNQLLFSSVGPMYLHPWSWARSIACPV